jgi:putative flippase GtrA
MSRVRREFLRYAAVGLVSNGVLYLLYLALTRAGAAPAAAMSVAYAAGVAQTFVFNRSWTFGHTGPTHAAFARYAVAYAVGYAANLAALAVLVDRWGWPHEAVQGASILLVAALVFALQRYWVFPAARTSG